MEKELLYCINHLILDKVRQILQKDDSNGSFIRLNLLSNAISEDETFSADSITESRRKELFFVLVDYERTFRSSDAEFGRRIHESLVHAARMKDVAALDVLLFSGCDLFHEVNEKETVYDVMMQDPTSDRIREVSDKYFPGIWNAVKTQDVVETKRLINLWCSCDTPSASLDGQSFPSLPSLARSTGNDIIIKLIDVTFHTLQLIHAVFAGNEYKVKKLLSCHRKSIQLDYRQFHPLGPSILYHAIRNNSIQIVDSLVKNGSKIYSLMLHPDDPSLGEVPILYAAISNPNLDIQMLQALLPGKDEEESKILHLMLFEVIDFLFSLFLFFFLSLCFSPHFQLSLFLIVFFTRN